MQGLADVQETTLANGLQLIVWPNHNIPNVTLHNWVRVGSRNEGPGTSGLAHFFEHMMFNGTARHGPGDFDRLMEAQGGSNNAFTSDDVTVYQDWFPRGALEHVIELEADRIANLSFVPEIIESERAVVCSERRLYVEDSNAGRLSERVQAAAFVAHPYRFPTIGLPADIRAWRVADLRRFFQMHYAPGNQTMVIAGDVESQQVFALARRHLASIPAREPPPALAVREPAQWRERCVRLRRRGQNPLLQYAYKAPAARDARAPAVRLLLCMLVEGDASLLHRSLVEEHKVAVEVSGDWHEGFDPGLLSLHLTLPEGADVRATQRLLDRELARIGERGVTPLELDRARNLSTASLWRQLATIDGKAHLLGEYAVLRGNWRALFEAPARLESVTSADIRSVARELLDPRRRTVGVLVPTGAGRQR
jgi:zinc protease